MIRCAWCHTTESELHKVDGENVCEECLDENGYVVCDSCNQYVHEDEITTRSEGPDICDYCLD